MTQPILITNFTGQAENPHIGFGVNVGVDLYTTKNVARLSRKMQKKSGSLADALPLHATEDNAGFIYVQLENGKILKSIDQGENWTLLAGNTGTSGKGLVVWQDYLWAFNPTGVDLYGPLSGVSIWTNGWTAFSGGNALINKSDVNHIPFPSPLSNAYMYITNESHIAQVQVLTFPFNPGGVANTDWIVLNQKLTMQGYYNAKCLGFLPTSSIAVGLENRLNNSQADIAIWDGTADASLQNLFTLPGATGAVTNLITRNGTIYATTTNEAGAYVVNGSSSQIVDRVGLRMTNRKIGGGQYTTRVQPTVRVQSADFLGPELLMGVCNFPSPVTQITDSGLYPYGVWAIDVESENVYTKYPLSHGDINANYTIDYEMGFVKVISNSKVIVGWGKSTTYGIDVLNASDYISDSATVFVESELLEVGTRVNPQTYTKLQFNLVQPLQDSEQIDFYYRTAQNQDYTAFTNGSFTSTNLGADLGGIINPLPFEKAKYIQIGARIKSGAGTPNQTPQLVSIYIS